MDRTTRWHTISPDDGNLADTTVAQLLLPEPVAPGAQLELQLEFRVDLPGIWKRTGRQGNFLACAQWFPKLGVFEPPPERPNAPAAWNCPQFHDKTEFYAEHGIYRVTLTLPEIYRGHVAATGTLIAETPSADGKQVTLVWQAHGVHDFAWFADPDFVVQRRTVTGDGVRAGGVVIEIFLQPEHVGLAARHLDPIEYGLRWFGRNFGPYPYPTIRAIDPQHNARDAGGMEYPTLIVCDARRLAPVKMATPEGVTLHEFGHQYFYGLVGNDEFEQAFLDEGFTSFAEKVALAEWFGPEFVASTFGPFYREGAPVVRPAIPGGALGSIVGIGSGDALGLAPGRLAAYAAEQPLLTFQPWSTTFPWQRRRDWNPYAGLERVQGTSWRSPDRSVFRRHAYSMTALTLESYRRARGDQALWGALREYVQTRAFRTGRPEDFLAAAEHAARSAPPAALAIEPRAYFEQVWKTPGWVDFAAYDLQCDGDSSTNDASCTAVVSRRGPFVLPVEIELEFADAHKEREIWNGDGGTYAVTRHGAQRVVAVRVDPDRRWVFDTDLTNNNLAASDDSSSLWRLFVALFHQLAQRLIAIGSAA
ncbi:MAG: M1 family aminopeptidase [Acidobacteriota bacterium]